MSYNECIQCRELSRNVDVYKGSLDIELHKST